uniref:FAD synthase n=1 Tax=Dunaliella tertiolecta TaxID=3047 RepID=A0A7S3QYH2_DUNTE|mmetsp:Transcript_21284/g.59016  ORF Transcript_21284/g.59016 Transcript_21284/m.59016 type:complete len:516 (-) Transcript_21284:490-2037(-)|eukprot:CAMPEP_0202350912 /NCGR_PEP_ID=MMETSP1126-20121109/7784_1 /ASSEMBLY_ACC=CAM_ASM_000457 /TAXON_ID=3047 /ORGANISM="Dunaliella tertiolecta, Strain CCMP1320" /LENGTH=515 /DNA_ID=CAMNT_0048942957 /DNA_START=1213 /DNA_END=2760 /DNA_ORIENTATION=-
MTPSPPASLLQQKVDKAVALLRRTLALYSPEQVAFSFNGGKDSTVLLQLLLTAVGGNKETGLKGIKSFIFTRKDDFPELLQFVAETNAQYSLGLEFMDSADFKAGLESYLSKTGVKAIVLGTRKDDPNAGDQQVFCPSSDGWPPFMRVNPIFDWTYHDVWTYLRSIEAPYCSLYDHGYTSLGGMNNTSPNRSLMRGDGSFSPAYLLGEAALERAGRASFQLPRPLPPNNMGRLAAPTSHPIKEHEGFTAALVIVGDELLSGKVSDTNTTFLCQELRSIGCEVVRVAIVQDNVEAIAEEVRRHSQVDVLITSGGVGPTLDDVTMEGISSALGRPAEQDPILQGRLCAVFGPDITPNHLKMAVAPSGCTTVIDVPGNKFPLVKAGENIYVLPGVPHLLRQKWQVVKDLLLKARPAEPFLNKIFRLSLYDETKIANALNQVHKENSSSGVNVGSYPVSDQTDGAKILVSLDCKKQDALEGASARMRELLPPGSIISEQQDVRSLDMRARHLVEKKNSH